MARIVSCSICSRQKSEAPGLLPARLRYKGSHIDKVERIACGRGDPLFILSGVYGFVSFYEEIPYYDHLLKADEVPALSEKIRVQLVRHGMAEIDFYTKTKPNWIPYGDALRQAAESLCIRLRVHELNEDD